MAATFDSALAAQAHADAALGQLAQKDGSLDAGDGERVVDDALAVLFGGAGAHHVLVGDPEPGQAALAVQVVERGAQQQQLGHGRGEVDFLGNADGVGAGAAQFLGQGEGGGAHGAVA